MATAAARDDGPSLSEVRQRRKMFPEVDLGGVGGERAKVDDAKPPSPAPAGETEAAAAAKEVQSSVPREMNDSSEDEAAEIKRVLVDQVGRDSE